MTRSHAGIALLAAAAFVTGCANHGTHTQAFKDKAELRVSQMKAATDWDLAQQQYLAGDLEKALRNVDHSIILNERVAKSYVLRGRILIELGRLEEALLTFDKALEIDTESHASNYYKGFIYERFSQFDPALVNYQQAAKLDPSNPQYVLAASEMLIDLDRLDEAEALLGTNKSIFEHNAGVRQTLGHIQMMRENHAEAVTHFSEASLLAPDDTSIVEDLTRALVASGRFGDAESNLRRLTANDSKFERRDLQHLRARCLVEIDRPVEARDILTRLATGPQGSSDVTAWSELADLSLKLKDKHRLREAAQRLIALAPASSGGYVFMALFQRETGKAELAAKTLIKAVELSPKDPAPALLRGMILADLGRREEASRSFALALERDPTNADALRMLRNASIPALAGAEVRE